MAQPIHDLRVLSGTLAAMAISNELRAAAEALIPRRYLLEDDVSLALEIASERIDGLAGRPR